MKLKFDPLFQKLELIEIIIAPLKEKKQLSFNLVTPNRQIYLSPLVSYSQINKEMGPTSPPRIMANMALASYEDAAISFTFEYSEREFKDGLRDLNMGLLGSEDNQLVKVNLQK